MQLSIRGLEGGGGIYWKSLACLWSKLKQYYPPPLLTLAGWLCLPFLLLLLHLYLGLFFCETGDFEFQQKLLIVLFRRPWEVQLHPQKQMVELWWDTPWNISSDQTALPNLSTRSFASYKENWGNWLCGEWGRWVDLTGRRKRERAWPALDWAANRADWSALKAALNLSAVNCPPHAQAFGLIGPLSDIDRLGVLIERQMRGKVGSGHDRKCSELLCFYFQY